MEETKKQSVVFLNIDKIQGQIDIKHKQKERYKYKNLLEAALCAFIVDSFRQSGVDIESFRILAPFQQ